MQKIDSETTDSGLKTNRLFGLAIVNKQNYQHEHTTETHRTAKERHIICQEGEVEAVEDRVDTQ